MTQSNIFLFFSVLVLSSLSACTDSKLFSGTNQISTNIPEASAETLQTIELLVLESMSFNSNGFSSAAVVDNSVASPAEPAFDQPSSDTFPYLAKNSAALETPLPEVPGLPPEPITPTVAMTANGVVEREMNDYLLNRRSLLRLWITRGETYFPMIEKIFAEEGVPDELKYLALGESGLRPQARSGAGAAGIWQFMPATARSVGLTVNNWVDERMDPEKSTRAAAHHFKELYESYNGNWHLVLAGYNCSYRCISRAVRRAGGSIDNPPSFWTTYPYLPRETRGFIPKFITASLIVSNPQLYGISTESSNPAYAYDVVEVNGMLTLANAATLAGTELTTIRNLNPSLRRTSLPASDQPFTLKLPLNSYDRFTEAFELLSEAERTPPGEYVVSSGDSLIKIAGKFDLSVAELRANNNIKGSLIRLGQTLLLPGRGAAITLASTTRNSVEYATASFRPIKLALGFELEQQPNFTPDNPFMMVSLTSEADGEVVVPTIYRVRSGDTLDQISKRFDVSIRDIQLWNNVSGTTIFQNQELTLHTPASIANINSYQVRSGDNLGEIAQRFGVSIDNLKRKNGLNNNLIFPGQNLQLN